MFSLGGKYYDKQCRNHEQWQNHQICELRDNGDVQVELGFRVIVLLLLYLGACVLAHMMRYRTFVS